MTSPGSQKHDATGRSTDVLKQHRRGRIEGQFVPFTKEMLESPAWGALTLADRKVIDRLCIEHMAHAGKENANLVCTYTDFEIHGVRRASLGMSIRRLEALGFVAVVERGRIAKAEFKFPARYRLTFVQGNIPATNEWKQVATAEEATDRVAKAGKLPRPSEKTKKPDAKALPAPDAESQPLTPIAGRESATPDPDAKTLPLSISRGGRPAAQPHAPGPANPNGRGRSACENLLDGGWRQIGDVISMIPRGKA
jgi:hypothetical protein